QRNVTGILRKILVVDVQNQLAVFESSDTDIEWAIQFICIREYSRTPGSIAKGNRHRNLIDDVIDHMSVRRAQFGNAIGPTMTVDTDSDDFCAVLRRRCAR